MTRRLDPAVRVARLAAAVVDSVGVEEIERARAAGRGRGGVHFVANGRLVALADAVRAWRLAEAVGRIEVRE